MSIVRLSLLAALAVSALATGVDLSAQTPQRDSTKARDTTKLAEITVFGSPRELAEIRDEIFRQPGSVSLVGPETLRGSRQANLKDALRFVPGVYIAPRQGAADESQISIRGSGLRNNYHARGLNVLINGMPYRNSDGFTDFESLELMSTEAITVYKGGNAFRFGGGTLGGAVNLHTRTGYTAKKFEVTGQGGSYDFYKGQVSSGGVTGPLDWYAAYSKMSLDGYREHSDQGRDRINAHLGYRLSSRTDVRAFYLYAHVSELLPGALTPADAASDPRQAMPDYITNRWSRYYDLHHVGVQLRSQLSRGVRFEVSPYYQYRDLDHPIFNILVATSNDMGAEFRLEALSGENDRNRLSAGVQPSRLRMDNRRYANVGGERGDLAKRQDDEADGLAAYVENSLRIADGVTAITGLRYERQRRATTDLFLSDGNQSDDITFEAWLPRLGVVIDASPAVQIYANASRSYEPPLIAELNSFSVPGFIDLEAQNAWQFELGTRGRHGGFRWDVAVYRADLRNEILNLNVPPFPGAPFTVPTYRNAERTRHVGLEAGAGYAGTANLFSDGDIVTLEGSLTFNRFSYVRDDLYEGNRIPGLPDAVFSGAIRYAHPAGFSLSPTVEFVPGDYYVDSQNTLENKGWAVFGVRAEYAFPRNGLTVFAALENLTDQRYSASVQIDNAVGQFYEPSDGRSFYAGFRWSR